MSWNSFTITGYVLSVSCSNWCDPTRYNRAGFCVRGLHFAFHSNRLTPTQSLRELVQAAQIAARQRGRPFDGLLDLLPNGDDETDDEAKIPPLPEEVLLRDLVTLAVTIRDDGQVNPLTVVDMTEGVTRLYRIETGERRYWASNCFAISFRDTPVTV
jgi:ParB-like nuclease domain